MLFCVQRERGRTPARSIDAATIKKPRYGCDCRLANGIYRHNSPPAPIAVRHFLATDEHRFTRINQEQENSDRKSGILPDSASRRLAGRVELEAQLPKRSSICGPRLRTELPLFLIS